MKRLLLVLFVAAVIGGSWFLLSRNQTEVEVERPEGISTEFVSRSDIEATTSATGSVAAERTQQITFATAGEVVAMFVQEDETIAFGQVLAVLDTEDMETSVDQAQAAVQISEAQLIKAGTKPRADEIAAAEAAVESAKAQLNGLYVGPTDEQRALAKLAVDQAKNSLYGAQANRDAIKGNRMATGAQKDQAEAQVLNAELAVTVAQVQQAQLDEGPKYAAVASAKAQIAQAESALQRLLSMPSQEDIDLVQSQVDQAKLNLQIARDRLADAELTAPMAGELVSWDLYVGDRVQPGSPVGTVVDTSRYHVMVSIDETDIGEIQVGQRAVVTLDAFPDQPISGRVSRIDLLGQNALGIIAFPVRIDLEPTDLAVRPLMTAAVDIVIESKENVLLINKRAIRRDKEGKYVEILVDNVLEKVYIETGVSDDDNSEVVLGLEDGQEVIVGRPRESLFSGDGFGGG